MNPLVTIDWLAARLDDPNTVILDATLPPVGISPVPDTRARYLERHIPGAVFFDIEAFSDHTSGLPHTLPSATAFARDATALGIGDSMQIVVYEQTGVFSAPRAWWMFRTFGARHVYVLDGGLEAWVEAGHATQTGEAERAPAPFEATLDTTAVRNFADVQGLIADGAQLLDARSAGRFSGTAPEPRAGLRSGHRPGATSLPFVGLVEDGRLKSPDALRQIFAARNLNLLQPVTTTCGSGVTAAVLALGLEIAGAPSVSLYDGSWAEYAQQPDAAIVTDTV